MAVVCLSEFKYDVLFEVSGRSGLEVPVYSEALRSRKDTSCHWPSRHPQVQSGPHRLIACTKRLSIQRSASHPFKVARRGAV